MQPIEFGQYLKTKRKEKKLSIRALEEASGVSNSYISQVERGDRGIPSPEVLKKLAEPLGVSYMELMYFSGHVPMEQVNSRWAGMVQLTSIRTFLEQVEQKLMENGQLKDEVNIALTQFLMEHDVIDFDADDFIDKMKNILEQLTDRLRQGEDVEDLFVKHAQLLRAQSFIYKQFLADPGDSGAVHDHQLPVVTHYELSKILGPTNMIPVHFNNRLLNEDERRRVLDMLQVLFPEQK